MDDGRKIHENSQLVFIRLPKPRPYTLIDLHMSSKSAPGNSVSAAAQAAALQQRRDERDSTLARNMFFVGLLGLPWLWMVNCFYFRPRISAGDAPEALKKWYYCSLFGSVVCGVGLLCWLIAFQTSWRRWDNAPDYMVYVPEEDQSGW